jgi:hypothetical protein
LLACVLELDHLKRITNLTCSFANAYMRMLDRTYSTRMMTMITALVTV